MARNVFLAGPGDVLIFKGNNLIGVGKTLSETTMNYTITAEEVRGGMTNALFGRYYHDSNLAVTITDTMFNPEYIAANWGTDIQMGGPSVKEEELVVGVTGNSVTLTETPIPYQGLLIGWYRKPTESVWQIGNITGNVMTIAGSAQNDHYCVKYFYQNENAQSIILAVDAVPAELHVVIINSLYSGSISNDPSDSSRVGRLITDIPRFQLDGSVDLTLAAGSTATVPLSGSATATSTGESCEEEVYYATMTYELYGEQWQDNVIALALEDAEIDLGASGSTATLSVRVIFGGSVAAQRKDNSNFTFTMTEGTATGTTVGENTGIITAGSTDGTGYVTVTLKDKADGPSAIAEVTVTGN